MTTSPTDPDASEGYNRCLSAMNAAAYAWYQAHPFASVHFRTHAFEQEMAARAGKPGQKPAIVAPLEAVIDQWADGEDAKSLLRAVCAAAEPFGGATYLMMKGLVEYQVEKTIERGQGQMLDGGDWTCRCCGKVLDGFSRFDGVGEKPEPGSFTLCMYCSAVLVVADDARHFESVPVDVVAAWPKPARDQVAAIRKALADMRAAEAKRS